jgi:hypothetical protein
VRPCRPGADGDSVRLSTGLIQFVAAHDVAATVAELTPGERARIGKVDFNSWFAANQQDAR